MRREILHLATIGVLGAFFTGPACAETVMQQCGHQYQDAKAAGTLNGMSWNQFRSDCATRLKAQPASATAPATAAAPASATAPATQTANPLNPTPAAATAAAPASTPAAPATASTSTAAKAPAPAATGGRAAFVAREKECGAEWRANKVSLTTQTPGLTWPKYLSQCNTRLKAAGK